MSRLTFEADLSFEQSEAGAVSRTVNDKLLEFAVTPQDFLAADESISVDGGPAIRRALATGKPVRFPGPLTYVVGPDPAPENEGGIGPGLFGWSLTIPSGARIIMDDGALLKAKDGIASWDRFFNIGGNTPVSDIAIFGELIVDANVANISATNNEHMHGVFIYDARGIYIERIHSVNARGDNIFIGGTDNTRGSYNLLIGSLYCEKAGRKNLVFQSCDEVRVGTAVLNNLTGGAQAYGGTPDDTDGHSLDVEPDNFTGAVRNSASIGHLRTYGSGNDFGSGIDRAKADNWILTIDEMVMDVTPRSNVAPWIQYGATVNIGDLQITGADQQMNIWYAARLNVEHAHITVTLASDYAILLAPVTADAQPEARFGRLKLTNTATAGNGIENRDGLLEIGEYNPNTTAIALWNRGTSSTAGFEANCEIGTLRAKDIGRPLSEGYALTHSQTGSVVPQLRIGYIDYLDTRGTKLNYFLSFSTGFSGVSVGEVIRCAVATAYPIYPGAGGRFRNGMNRFSVLGSPESVVAAPVGSQASRLDGGAGTCLYVKESGTGDTGWVAK